MKLLKRCDDSVPIEQWVSKRSIVVLALLVLVLRSGSRVGKIYLILIEVNFLIVNFLMVHTDVKRKKTFSKLLQNGRKRSIILIMCKITAWDFLSLRLRDHT
jgi:hypothetical protein